MDDWPGDDVADLDDEGWATDTEVEALQTRLADLLGPMLAPPVEAVEAAKESYGWRVLDAELARLTRDSLVAADPIRTRTEAEPRTLTFEAGDRTVEVDVIAGPDGRRVVGLLEPAGGADVAVLVDEMDAPAPVTATVTATSSTDALGRFVVPLPRRRVLMSLQFTFPGGSILRTARIRI